MTEAKTIREAYIMDDKVIKEAKDWESFVSLFLRAKEVENKLQWFKGDIVTELSIKYGDTSLKKFAQDVGESATAMEHYRRVARAFPVGMRNWDLSWTHYFIASFTDSYKKGLKQFSGRERFDWIKDAHDNNWSTTRLTDEITTKKALSGKDDEIFNYYNSIIKKTRNILLHIEKNKLTEDEKTKLIHSLLDVYNEFMVYLKS